MHDPRPLAEKAAALLIAREQRIAVAESSAGGLISAALLAVPGASKYFVGGGVIYTGRALKTLLGVTREDVASRGMRSSSEPYAQFLAETVRERHRVDWGLSETGAAGPTGNPYGDLPATRVTQSPAPSAKPARSAPAAPTAPPTCGPSPKPRSRFWWKHWSARRSGK